MIRKAFRRSVHPGQHVEYERRHRPIWPELEQILLAHGVRTYSIYLDELTGDLFGYVEVDDESRWAAVADTDVCRRGWKSWRGALPAEAANPPVWPPRRGGSHTGA